MDATVTPSLFLSLSLARIRRRWSAVAIALLVFGCATARRIAAPDVTVLAVVGTNDLHGTLEPEVVDTKDGAGRASTKYRLGGASTLASYVDVLRREYGDRLLWLDAGDEFQGALESNVVEGASVVRFFNAAGLGAAAIGNHEFDFGAGAKAAGDPRGALKARIAEARYPFVSANIVERATGSDALPTPRSVVLTVGGVRVGVIGLTTVMTPVTTWPGYVADLSFTDLAVATRREAANVRAKGAEVVLLVAHAGLDCGAPDTHSRMWTLADPQQPCGSNDELVRLLTALPANTVDAVVSGHSHSVIHHWVAGVPVVQGEWKGHFLNVIYIPYSRKERRVLRDSIRIEGPVRNCTSVFAAQGDCDGSRAAPDGGRGALVAATFHGSTIEPAVRIEQLLAPVFAQVAALKARVVAQAARPLRRAHNSESEMGNLVSDAMRAKARADFALVNAGGIRGAFAAGPITFGDVFAALPFDNHIAVLRVTGRELRTLVRVAESGAVGYFPVAGLRVVLSDCVTTCPGDDLDGNGTVEPWERNHLVMVTTESGAAIEDERVYTLATNDFVVSGGDYMGWPISRVAPERVEVTPTLIRDAVLEYLQALQTVNTPERPLVSHTAPRIAFVESAGAASKELR